MDLNNNNIKKFQFKKVKNNTDIYIDDFTNYLLNFYNKNIIIKINSILDDLEKFIKDPRSKYGYELKFDIINSISTVFNKIIMKSDNKYYTSGFDYELVKYIHKATYADVYEYKDKIIKRIKIRGENIQIFTLFFESLIHSYLYYLNNNYVTKIYYVSLSTNKTFGDIISERIEITFDDFVTNNLRNVNILNKYYIILTISIELAKIINFYQSKCNFVHGDLKLNNFMIFFDKKDKNNKWKIKLIDFGFSGINIEFNKIKYYITNPDCYHSPDMYNVSIMKDSSKKILDLLFYTLYMLCNDIYYINKVIITRFVKILNINNFDNIQKIYNNKLDNNYIYKYVRGVELNKLKYYKNFIPLNYINILEKEKRYIINKLYKNKI